MKKLILLLSIVLLSGYAQAKWKNPSERYSEAHKEYTKASCPIASNNISNFVYFSKDREQIKDHLFLSHKRFSGAQIMYAWKDLEPKKGQYDFSTIQADYDYLKAHGKRLFIQLQDTTFYPQNKAVPRYLETKAFDNGVICQQEENSTKCEGWVAKRWNKKVQQRFALLLNALGKQFDGKIEGINLQETAIGVSNKRDASFTPKGYTQAIKTNMLALKKAFPTSVTMQYANFMPGEWLPWEDEGYLKSIYQYGEKIGVGLGAPDLMVKRKGQLNHALAMMHENKYTVPLGIAIQDGNYIGLTGADGEKKSQSVKKNRKNIVPLLTAFADDFLHVNYLFWVNQAPYFEQDVLPCFESIQQH